MFDKEFVKNIRKQVIENAKLGGLKQRSLLLAYGYVRNIPYRVIETKINEDKFSPEGQLTFLMNLSTYVAGVINKILDPDLYKDGRYHSAPKELVNAIFIWMKQPLEKQEAA